MSRLAKNKKVIMLLLGIFTFLFLIFPLSYGITNIRMVIILTPFLFLGIYILNKIKIREKYYIWIILLLALVTRVGVVLLLNSRVVQVSDFAVALNNSFELKFVGDYYKVFTHWILYPVITNFVYKIFGSSQLVALLLNAVILVLSSCLIYKLAYLLFNNKKCGFYAAMLYILWPANILYTLIYTQEHFCTLLLLIVLYLFFKNEKSGKLARSNIISLILIGVLLGISTFFKNFAPVFIIAFLIFYILKFLSLSKINNFILVKFISIVLIVISYSVSKNVVFSFIDNLVGDKVARNIIPCYLNVGLRDNGTYSDYNYGMYFNTLKDNDYDYEKTNSIVMNNLIDDQKDVLSLKFFSEKAKILFGGDFARMTWVQATLVLDSTNINIINISKLNSGYFCILIIFMFLGLIYMNKLKNLDLFLLYLIFYGSFLLLLLVEAQNRYMYAIQFIMCILAVGGINYMLDIIKRSGGRV